MPRPLRPIEEGLIYHVVNRGNNRQSVFRKKGDFEAFLTALGELKERKPFELYGYCLLNNHFHLLIRPGRTSISRTMQSLLVSHTQRYHKQYHSGGHVWQGRFKSSVVQNDEHLLTVLRYIEANPLRADIVNRAEDYPWSSYPTHGLGVASILLDPLLTYEELSPYAAVRQRRWAAMVHRPFEEHTLASIRRSNAMGLPYGEVAWVERLAKELGLDLTIRPRGRPKKNLLIDLP
ncbi:MAG TPA: transposase [Pirellulales bacterium]